MAKMQDYKKKTEKVYKTPRTVQELIPVYRVSEDGIFELEKKPEEANKLYDMAFLFEDTNFATMDTFEQEDFLKLYCATLNSLNVSFKITIMNNNQNMRQIRESVFLRQKDGRFPAMVESLNQHMEDTLTKGRAGIDQARLFILTCERRNIDQARDYFRSVEASLAVSFNRMKSRLIPLNADERLRYLHAFYRMGEESDFGFHFNQALRRGEDWKSAIAPRTIRHWQDEYGKFDGKTLEVDGRFVRALYLPKFPNAVDTRIIQRLAGGNWHVILTIDAAVIPQEITRKTLDNLYLQNARAIEKQQEARNRARAWSSDITYDRRREKEELESCMDIINENDEKMFYTGVYALLTAHSKTELDNDTVAFCAAAEGEGFVFRPASWEQIDCMNTALPTGARYFAAMQPLFTQPLCAITPFVVHELYRPGPESVFYGVNQVSKNILIGDRKQLTPNGNGFILGVTGSGKGMDAKTEMVQVFLRTKDDIIIIDPQNEYKDITAYLDGQFIEFGAASKNYINPLDTGTMEYMESRKAFLADKEQTMCGIFAQITDEITAQDKSLISRCVEEVYQDYDEKQMGSGKPAPTLVDFYHVLRHQPELQAHELMLALELFVNGSLDMFAKQSNVDMKKRLTVYGISDIGNELSGIGMLIMLEGIRARIARNAKKGRATWLYVDEFHNLAGNEYSARCLEKSWKEVRKMGGICTAMTQNIADCLASKTVETMLSNSQYISLLNQSELEIDILGRTLGISDNLLEYVRNSEVGCGLLKFGNRYIPKDMRMPKDSEMYRLFNTNFHEIQRMKKKEKKLKAAASGMPEAVERSIRENPTPQETVYLPG